MTRTNRKETTPEETKTNNDVLGDILKSAHQESQEMLQGMEREVREVTYNYDNPLEIPAALDIRMEGEGYKLRWLRFKINGAHDTKNITRRIRQGYTLVTRGEAKELALGLPGSSDGEFIVVDDSVLAKISHEQHEVLRGMLDDKANHQEEGIRSEFREQALANRLDPGNIRDTSKSSVSGGSKRRNFAKG